jgi:hypothetical protein
VDLNPVTVELDFVDPARPGGYFLNRGRQRGLDESGEGRLDADRGRFFPLERHIHTTQLNWGFKPSRPDSFRSGL